MSFRLVIKSATLNDLERRNGVILRHFTEFGNSTNLTRAHCVKVIWDVVVKKFTFAISSPDELLVLLFVNDIPEWIKTNVRMFADDTKIWTQLSGPEDAVKLQEDPDNVNWSVYKMAFEIQSVEMQTYAPSAQHGHEILV